MKTISIQIGNSDDKLTQRKWHLFCAEMGDAIDTWCAQIHFYGHSYGSAEWQNACWVIDMREDASIENLKEEIKDIRKRYNQDSVAWIMGQTEMI